MRVVLAVSRWNSLSVPNAGSARAVPSGQHSPSLPPTPTFHWLPAFRNPSSLPALIREEPREPFSPVPRGKHAGTFQRPFPYLLVQAVPNMRPEGRFLREEGAGYGRTTDRIGGGHFGDGDSSRRPLHLLPRSEEHTSELQSRGHLVCR